MVKKKFLYSVFFILLFFVEAIIRPITVFGISPMYVLCGIVAVGILEGEKTAVVFGLIFGLMCDFVGCSIFGLHAINFMITGIVSGLIVKSTLSRNPISAVIISECSIIFFGTIHALFYTLFNEVPISEVVYYILLPKMLLTLPFTCIIYYTMKFIKRISETERKRKKIW